MPHNSWLMNRRTLLQGAGAALALPLLDAMGDKRAAATDLPKRMCCIYFPFGVAMPADRSDQRQWGWFPTGKGKEYQLTNPLRPLEPLRSQFTVFGGLSHPAGRKLGGHDTGDTFLTASDLGGSQFTNSVSIDQLAAVRLGKKTRFPSLVLSSDGGVGEPTRSTTISFSRDGKPVPALASPKQIFSRLFGKEDSSTIGARRQQIENNASLLDLILEHAKSLNHKLGHRDRRKLAEYMDSVREVEKRVERSQRWLDMPKPKVEAEAIEFAVDQKAPKEYLRAMYDLMFLALQTDTTRLTTYMIGQVAGATTIANAFPASIGLSGNWHGLAHGAGKKGGAQKLGRFDQFLTEQLSYFLQRLADAPEGDGSLLDRTLVLYGSSNSKTHQNRNYPLLLAGGASLGLKHGQYLRFDEKTPLSNLFVTMLDRIGVSPKSFADSTGEVSEII